MKTALLFSLLFYIVLMCSVLATSSSTPTISKVTLSPVTNHVFAIKNETLFQFQSSCWNYLLNYGHKNIVIESDCGMDIYLKNNNYQIKDEYATLTKNAKYLNYKGSNCKSDTTLLVKIKDTASKISTDDVIINYNYVDNSMYHTLKMVAILFPMTVCTLACLMPPCGCITWPFLICYYGVKYTWLLLKQILFMIVKKKYD